MVLSPIDYVIIALYFIAIVAIGFAAARLSKTQEDYLVAGRRLSFPLFFGCMAALTLGGGSTIGSAELGYEHGLGGIWLNLSIGLGLVLAGFLVTSKLSRLRALSVNEVVESSYGPIARVFSSALTLIYTLTLSVVQVISIGTIINGVTGIDATLSMLVGGGIVILYTFVGGMWSVMVTDHMPPTNVYRMTMPPPATIDSVGSRPTTPLMMVPMEMTCTTLSVSV